MDVLTVNSGAPGEQVALLTQQGDALPCTLAAPSSLSGSTPLSSVLYVDGGNTATGTPNGSQQNPFRTIQAAVDAGAALTQLTIYIAPGVYAESPAVAAGAEVINFVGMTSTQGFLENVDPTPIDHEPVEVTGTFSGAGANMGFESLTCLAINAGGTANVQLRNVKLTNNAIQVIAGNVDAWTNKGYRLRANVTNGNITSEGYSVFEAHCGSLDVIRSPGGMGTIQIGAGGGPMKFLLADWDGAAATIDASAIISMDLYSYESALKAGVALPLNTTIIGAGVLQHAAFDSTASPVDQTLLPAGHAPGLYSVGTCCVVSTPGAHTLTPTVRGGGEGGAFEIGNNPAWTAVDTSAPKTVGFAPCCVFSDGTTPLVLRWTWDSTGGDIADVVIDSAALPFGG